MASPWLPWLPSVDGEHEPRHRTPPAHLADAEDFGDDRRLRWTTLEDQKIVEAVRLLGKRWPEIAALLPGRTTDGVRNRWQRLESYGQGEPEEGAPPLRMPDDGAWGYKPGALAFVPDLIVGDQGTAVFQPQPWELE